MTTELTLDAALRDVDHEQPDVRNRAIRNLAPALLERVGERGPVVWARSEHSMRTAVVEALDRACADKAPHNVGLAILGLAQIGAPQARERALAGLAGQADDEASMFVRECSVIALSMLGRAARTEGDGSEVIERVAADLRALLDDPRDDVRFQVGPALVETLDTAAEPELLAALARESHPEVRENLIAAIAMIDPPSPVACDKLAELLAGDEGRGPIGWEIALALTAARRPEGGPRLVETLRVRALRDDALEALAVLGPNAPAEAGEAVAKLMRGWLVPVFTQVRAAYAMARIRPAEGEARLEELARSMRSAVREAVVEARANLAKLASEDSRRRGSAYRRDL
jgi:HEAT repeat protein